MSMDLFFKAATDLAPLAKRGELETCYQQTRTLLLSQPKSPFHIAADLQITNDPATAAAALDAFYLEESKNFPIKALYIEMNGFDINPRLWYFDAFALDTDEGLDETYWFSNWKACSKEKLVVITGLETLQHVYKTKSLGKYEISYLSSFLVVTLFQRFIQQTVPHLKYVRVPLYATAHEYDYVARCNPNL